MGQSVSPMVYRSGLHGCWSVLDFHMDGAKVYSYLFLNAYLFSLFNSKLVLFGFMFGHLSISSVGSSVYLSFYVYYNPMQYFISSLFYRGSGFTFRFSKSTYLTYSYVLFSLASLWSEVLSKFFERSFPGLKFFVLPVFVSKSLVTPSILSYSMSRKFMYKSFSFGSVVGMLTSSSFFSTKKLGGFSLTVSGRFMRSDRSVSNRFSSGSVPTSSVGVPMPYFCFVARSRYGSFSVSVYLSFWSFSGVYFYMKVGGGSRKLSSPHIGFSSSGVEFSSYEAGRLSNSFLMVSLDYGSVYSEELEASSSSMRSKIRSLGKVYLSVSPTFPFTKKSEGVRMGKGKGKMAGYFAFVKPGKILFEMRCPSATVGTMRSALLSGVAKLSVKSKAYSFGQIYG